MGGIKDLLNKLPYLLICVLFMGKLAWDYFDFIESPASDLGQKKQTVQLLIEDVKNLNAKKDEAETFLKTLESKKMSIRNLAKELAEMKIEFNEEIDTPGFLKQISTEAKKIGLRVQGIKPLKSQQKENYVEHQFNLQFAGVYPQVISFIQRMARVQHVVKVDNLNIKRVGSPDNKLVEINGSLSISAFTYHSTSADEKAGKLQGGSDS